MNKKRVANISNRIMAANTWILPYITEELIEKVHVDRVNSSRWTAAQILQPFTVALSKRTGGRVGEDDTLTSSFIDSVWRTVTALGELNTSMILVPAISHGYRKVLDILGGMGFADVQKSLIVVWLYEKHLNFYQDVVKKLRDSGMPSLSYYFLEKTFTFVVRENLENIPSEKDPITILLECAINNYNGSERLRAIIVAGLKKCMAIRIGTLETLIKLREFDDDIVGYVRGVALGNFTNFAFASAIALGRDDFASRIAALL